MTKLTRTAIRVLAYLGVTGVALGLGEHRTPRPLTNAARTSLS
jgi:hypothetical protein